MQEYLLKEDKMDNPVENFWEIRLEEIKNQLEKNNFQVFISKDLNETKRIVLEKIIPSTSARTVSWGTPSRVSRAMASAVCCESNRWRCA